VTTTSKHEHLSTGRSAESTLVPPGSFPPRRFACSFSGLASFQPGNRTRPSRQASTRPLTQNLSPTRTATPPLSPPHQRMAVENWFRAHRTDRNQPFIELIDARKQIVIVELESPRIGTFLSEARRERQIVSFRLQVENASRMPFSARSPDRDSNLICQWCPRKLV